MSGVVRSKTEGDDFTFAPVSAGKLKYVLLYSLPDTQLFHIVEGTEGNEAIYPDLPPGALLIKAVLISEFGALLEDADGGYKPLAEDPWRNIVINNNAAINVVMASSPSCSFNVLVGAGSTAPKIAGIRTKVKKNTRDGQEITLYNDSDTPVALLPGDYEETLVYTTFPFEEAYELKPRSFGKFKRKNNKYKELPAGGGKASEVENDSTVTGASVKDALEHVQAEIDAEIVNRALADTNLQGQIAGKQDKSIFSALADKWIHYYDSATAKMQPIIKLVTGAINQLEFEGRMKVASLILPPNSSAVVANRLRSDGNGLYYANDLAVERKISLGSVFTYTPTGNFTLSQVKTALEATGMIFNDSNIAVNLGANSYTCTIDIGAANVGQAITVERTGSGSISFASSRALDIGADAITILNGKEISQAKIKFGTNVDFLIIRLF